MIVELESLFLDSADDEEGLSRLLISTTGLALAELLGPPKGIKTQHLLSMMRSRILSMQLRRLQVRVSWFLMKNFFWGPVTLQ
jgi:hypothetical protein